MPPSELPAAEELAQVESWLEGGRRGIWTRDDWQAWQAKAYDWCLTSTRGCRRASQRIRELEAENALLRAELAETRQRSAPPVPAIRRATPPPPPAPSGAEAAALAGYAQRPPTDAERELRRRLREIADEVWREVSSVDLEAEVWADDAGTVFEEP